METARGRWFLAEYARRNRAADTAAVLEALARLEAKLAASRQPAAAAVPSVAPAPAQQEDAPAQAARQGQESEPAFLREPPRIPEPDFSAVEQLFHGRKALDWPEPAQTVAKSAAEYDDEPWPPEADDPPAEVVASGASDPEEEDPEVEEEDIEAWEAELNEMEQPVAAELEPPEEFSFFRRIETRGATALAAESRPVVEPPRPLPGAEAAWPAPKPAEPRSIFPKPEVARPAMVEIPRPSAVPPIARNDPFPTPPLVAERAEPLRPAEPAMERPAPKRPASSLLERLEPSRPTPAPAPKAERAPSRPAPRVDDPTVTMTRDEKLAMFS